MTLTGRPSVTRRMTTIIPHKVVNLADALPWATGGFGENIPLGREIVLFRTGQS